MTDAALDLVAVFSLVAGDALLFSMVVLLSLSTAQALVSAIQIFRE